MDVEGLLQVYNAKPNRFTYYANNAVRNYNNATNQIVGMSQLSPKSSKYKTSYKKPKFNPTGKSGKAPNLENYTKLHGQVLNLLTKKILDFESGKATPLDSVTRMASFSKHIGDRKASTHSNLTSVLENGSVTRMLENDHGIRLDGSR